MGIICLVLAEYANIFGIISMPLVPFFRLLGFPLEISKSMVLTIIIGFADMYLPSLLIESIPSEMVRVIVGTLSFAQLIFLSETGMILVSSKIGFNFFDVLKVFIIRTLLTFPVIFIIAKILFSLGILVN
jgi:nucleoside recognition membrane protein YjiH